MNNKYVKYNPKALNLDAIQESNAKVTLGFKCDPELKLQLAQEAEEYGLTLSSYTEALIEGAEQFILLKNKEEKKALTNIIEEQQRKINFYEAPLLKQLLYDNINKEINYINEKGQNTLIKIQTIEDVFSVIICSFKKSKG